MCPIYPEIDSRKSVVYSKISRSFRPTFPTFRLRRNARLRAYTRIDSTIDRPGLSTGLIVARKIYIYIYTYILQSNLRIDRVPPPPEYSEYSFRKRRIVVKLGEKTKFSNRFQRSQIINYTSERNSNHRSARSDVYDRERGNPAACKPREPALSRAYKRETLSTGGFSNSYSCEADRCAFRFQRRERSPLAAVRAPPPPPPPPSPHEPTRPPHVRRASTPQPPPPGTDPRIRLLWINTTRDTWDHACAFSTRIVKPSEVARDTYEGVRQRTEAYR